MSGAAIVGPDAPFAVRLAADLGWPRVAPDAGELEALGDRPTLVYAAPAGVGLDGLPDLAAAERVFRHAAGSGVSQLVLVSSAAVHQPDNHHLGMVSEARLPRRATNAVALAWRRLEALAREALAGSATVLTVLRPAAVPLAGGGDYLSRFFARRLAVTAVGFDPPLQLLSPADLAEAVRRAVEKGREAGGTFHVAPAAVMPLRRALRAAGGRRLPVPRALQWLARRAFAPRAAATADQAEYLRHSWTVSADKIRAELGVEPALTSAAAVAALDPRRQGREVGEEGELDDFGLDKEYVARLGRTLFRFLHDVYWRVEHRGLEHLPRRGRGVLAGVHRGHQPWDGVMTFHLLVRELGRYPRFLVHPTLIKFPFLTPYMTRIGGVPACRENAAWVLRREGLVGIYPEGIRGAFARYKNAYRLRKFGRDEFVKIALENRAPIIPFVTVGSAEIFPILAKIRWRWWQRYSEWPCLPITPTMGLLPLPSKWHMRFLEPLHVEEQYPPEAAGDREVVRSISLEVRQRMETAIGDMLRRRRRIFWGSVFEDEE